MKSNYFSIRNLPAGIDIALLLVRIVAGSAFILFGWSKIQHPLHWMGPDSAFPAILQALAAISEFAGGIALILGLLARLAAFGIACTMVVATYMHAMVFGDPFVNMTGGEAYYPALVFLVIMILIIITGPGRISIDRMLFGFHKK